MPMDINIKISGLISDKNVTTTFVPSFTGPYYYQWLVIDWKNIWEKPKQILKESGENINNHVIIIEGNQMLIRLISRLPFDDGIIERSMRQTFAEIEWNSNWIQKLNRSEFIWYRNYTGYTLFIMMLKFIPYFLCLNNGTIVIEENYAHLYLLLTLFDRRSYS